VATSTKNFKEANVNLFLVLKAFWLDEDVKSSLATSKDGVSNFDFHLVSFQFEPIALKQIIFMIADCSCTSVTLFS